MNAVLISYMFSYMLCGKISYLGKYKNWTILTRNI